MTQCKTCNGHGSVKCPRCGGKGGSYTTLGQYLKCSNCNGSGQVKCNVCNGKGTV